MEGNQIILQGTTCKQLIEDLKSVFIEVLQDQQSHNTVMADNELMTREDVCDLLQIINMIYTFTYI